MNEVNASHLAARLIAECQADIAALEAIKLPPHKPTIAIEELLAGYLPDDREDHWEAIKAYADIHARRVLQANAPTQPAVSDEPYRDPRTGAETWSANGEDWHNYSSIEELIRESEHDFIDLEVGSEVYVGIAHYYDPATFVDHESLIQGMNDNAAQSDAGEWVDAWPEPGKDAEAELKAMLEAWARRHCAPDFYVVQNVRTYIITAEDIAKVAPIGIDSEGGSHD